MGTEYFVWTSFESLYLPKLYKTFYIYFLAIITCLILDIHWTQQVVKYEALSFIVNFGQTKQDI